MSVEEDVMKIQKKLTKMTSEDGTVSAVFRNTTYIDFPISNFKNLILTNNLK